MDECKKYLSECEARCCKVITLLLKKNRTPEEEDDTQLVLAHEGTVLKEEEGVQYIEIDSRCKYLTKDNECSIYDKRFNLCKRYKCEKIGGENDQVKNKTSV